METQGEPESDPRRQYQEFRLENRDDRPPRDDRETNTPGAWKLHPMAVIAGFCYAVAVVLYGGFSGMERNLGSVEMLGWIVLVPAFVSFFIRPLRGFGVGVLMVVLGLGLLAVLFVGGL